jgi:recombination protein RecA
MFPSKLPHGEQKAKVEILFSARIGPMPRHLSALRSEVESALAGRIPAPFTHRNRKLVETVSAGIPEIDSLTGGLPRGGLTEICGPSCSGRTSLLISALASRTADAEVCAFIDGRDAFDPHSAEAAGVKLNRLLWVRCRNIDQALRSTDLLLQGGGFGIVALDLGDIPMETVRHVPLNVWFRFRRAVEDTPTIFLVLEREPHAKTCASLVLRMGMEATKWSRASDTCATKFFESPHAFLFDGCVIGAELERSRIQEGANWGGDARGVGAKTVLGTVMRQLTFTKEAQRDSKSETQRR